jgi:CBS domain-containing protein
MVDLTVGSVMSKQVQIPQGSPDDTVGSVISQFQGSHEPVFVIDSKGKYLGSVWPYHLLYLSKPFFKEKLKSVLVKTSALTPNDPVLKVVEQMISLRLYTLPIFEKGRISGVIMAREILRKLYENKDWREKVSEFIEFTPALVAEGHVLVRDVYSQMRKENLSRVLVVDREGNLEGIVGRRDIYMAVMAPPMGKQRYSVSNTGQKTMDFDEDWDTKLDYPLMHLVKRKRLATVNKGASVWDIAKKLLLAEVGSVVILENLKPVGTLSVRPFLKAIISESQAVEFPVKVTDRRGLLDAYHRDELWGLLQKHGKRWGEMFGVTRIEAVLDASKNAIGKAFSYRIELKVVGNKNKRLISDAQNHKLRAVYNDALAKIDKQLRRTK